VVDVGPFHRSDGDPHASTSCSRYSGKRCCVLSRGPILSRGLGAAEDAGPRKHRGDAGLGRGSARADRTEGVARRASRRHPSGHEHPDAPPGSPPPPAARAPPRAGVRGFTHHQLALHRHCRTAADAMARSGPWSPVRRRHGGFRGQLGAAGRMELPHRGVHDRWPSTPVQADVREPGPDRLHLERSG